MSLGRLLNPESVALVGASPDRQKISGMMVDFLRRSGFAGRVYPVNPRHESIGDWRCYPSVEALPERVDVVVIAVPVGAAFAPLEAAARRGVPHVVLMTGGFGEGASGDEGARRLARLTVLCRETGLRVLGPNTVGMVNFRARMPLTFADWYGRDTGQRGGVAILTHSGSVGGLIFSSLQLNRVGVDFWVATGNEATLEVADFIDHLSEDPDLHTIVCFIEGVMNGRRLMAAAARAGAAGKRIVALKAGNSPPSLRATVAHTGKDSTGEDLYRAVFRQLGIVEVRSLEELTYAVKLLTTVGARARGSVGILSASGGACSLIADHVAQAGLLLPELPSPVQRNLARAIPEYGCTRNPVDLSADVVSRREILTGSFEALGDDDAVDTWLVFGRPIIDRYHADIREFARRTGKAVVASSGVPLPPDIEAGLQEDGVAVLADPDTCARALGALRRAAGAKVDGGRRWEEFRRRRPGPRPADPTAVGDVLRRYHLTGEAGAGAPEPAVSALLRVAVRQDKDFGPVLSVSQTGEEAGPAGAVALRALPLRAEEIDDLLAEISAAGGSEGDASPRAPGLARILETLGRMYGQEAWIAELEASLASEARTGRSALRDVVIVPAADDPVQGVTAVATGTEGSDG